MKFVHTLFTAHTDDEKLAQVRLKTITEQASLFGSVGIETLLQVTNFTDEDFRNYSHFNIVKKHDKLLGFVQTRNEQLDLIENSGADYGILTADRDYLTKRSENDYLSMLELSDLPPLIMVTYGGTPNLKRQELLKREDYLERTFLVKTNTAKLKNDACALHFAIIRKDVARFRMNYQKMEEVLGEFAPYRDDAYICNKIAQQGGAYILPTAVCSVKGNKFDAFSTHSDGKFSNLNLHKSLGKFISEELDFLPDIELEKFRGSNFIEVPRTSKRNLEYVLKHCEKSKVEIPDALF